MRLWSIAFAAVVGAVASSPAWAQSTIGISVAGKADGYSQLIHDAAIAGQVNISIEGAMSDPARQLDEIQNWIARGVSAMVVEPTDTVLTDQFIHLAGDAAIPLVIIGNSVHENHDEAGFSMHSAAVDVTAEAAKVFDGASGADLDALTTLATTQIVPLCPTPAPQSLAVAIIQGQTAPDRLTCTDDGSQILNGVQQAIVMIDGGSHSGGYFAPASGSQHSGGALAPVWVGTQDSGGYVTPPEVSGCQMECWPCGGGTGECCGMSCGF